MVSIVLEQDLAAGTYQVTPVEPRPSPKPPERIVAFSQRDPRWAKIHLGGSRYTMGGAGCAVTAATMIATQIRPGLTPREMVEWLNSNGGFTSTGLLYWAKPAMYVTGLTFGNYYVWRQMPADMDVLHRYLSEGPQVVQVDFTPRTSALDSHFVVALSFTENAADLNIIDPWTGERGHLLDLYAQDGWDLARAVYALAEYRVE